MNTKRVLFSAMLVLAGSSHAQTLNGLVTGNYAGIAGLNFNPASIVDSRYKFDLNIAAAQVYFTNNYLYANPLIFAKRKLFREPYNGSFAAVKQDLIKPIEPPPNEKVFARQNAELQLPLSFMLTTGRKSAIALNMRNRNELAVGNLNPNTAKLLYEELDYAPLKGVPMNNDSFALKFMNWQEVGFTYGRILIDAQEHFFKAAVTAKWLGGNAAAFIQSDDLTVSLANPTTLSMNSPNIQYARTARADFDAFNRRDLFNNLESQNVGFDIGIVYEFRGKLRKYKYTDEDYMTQLRRDKNKYMLRLGAALNDIGYLQYNRLPLTRDHSANITNWDFSGLNANNLREWDSAYSKLVNYIPGGSEVLSVQLPTALLLNADLRLFGGFYINAAMQRRVNALGSYNKETTTQIIAPEWYAITPRFEGRFFGLYVPVVFRNNTRQIGATVRIGPFYAGSNNLLALIQNSQVPTADIHAGFRIPIGFGKPTKIQRAFEKSTGVKLSDAYEKSIDSSRQAVASLDSRLARIERAIDSGLFNPPTVVVNNYISDSAGTRTLISKVEQEQSKSTAANNKKATSTNQPKSSTPSALSKQQQDSLMREYQKMEDEARNNLRRQGIVSPEESSSRSAAKRAKRDEKNASKEKSNAAKQAKSDRKARDRADRQNAQYNRAVEQELRRMRQQQAVTNTALVTAITAGVVVDANKNQAVGSGQDTVVIRDTIVVTIRDTIYRRDTGSTTLQLVSRQPTTNTSGQTLQPNLSPTAQTVPELRKARVFFASGSAAIGQQYTQVLNQAAGWMHKHPERRVLLTGVTDATGSAAHNRHLAQKRIDAVKAAMAKRGIDASRFEIKIQVSDTKTTKASSNNRRVDMSVIR